MKYDDNLQKCRKGGFNMKFLLLCTENLLYQQEMRRFFMLRQIWSTNFIHNCFYISVSIKYSFLMSLKIFTNNEGQLSSLISFSDVNVIFFAEIS
jgi:hypothetical protein